MDVQKIFQILDRNGDQHLDQHELAVFLMQLDKGWTEDRLERLFRVLDLDGDGLICFQEFVAWVSDYKDVVVRDLDRFRANLAEVPAISMRVLQTVDRKLAARQQAEDEEKAAEEERKLRAEEERQKLEEERRQKAEEERQERQKVEEEGRLLSGEDVKLEFSKLNGETFTIVAKSAAMFGPVRRALAKQVGKPAAFLDILDDKSKVGDNRTCGSLGKPLQVCIQESAPFDASLLKPGVPLRVFADDCPATLLLPAPSRNDDWADHISCVPVGGPCWKFSFDAPGHKYFGNEFMHGYNGPSPWVQRPGVYNFGKTSGGGVDIKIAIRLSDLPAGYAPSCRDDA